jgi:hypothetical protein
MDAGSEACAAEGKGKRRGGMTGMACACTGRTRGQGGCCVGVLGACGCGMPSMGRRPGHRLKRDAQWLKASSGNRYGVDPEDEPSWAFDIG